MAQILAITHPSVPAVPAPVRRSAQARRVRPWFRLRDPRANDTAKSTARLLPMIKNAGAIFLGEWTPEALGDYSAGPNHTLPTGGTARFSSPLGVYDFIKRSSLLNFMKKGFLDLAETVKTIAMVEGLEAHSKTVTVREDFSSC